MASSAPVVANQLGNNEQENSGLSLQEARDEFFDQQKARRGRLYSVVAMHLREYLRGSKFFNNREIKDRVAAQKIERILASKQRIEGADLDHHLRLADDYLAELEISRDLTQTIIHVDCDAFFAAVEELDRPELKHVPMAVGKSILSTCNYHARKFGCRSGMAGFVALKLCPNLICLPLNFEKYNAKAHEVREIFTKYDPRFEAASIDEAYLNITKYCQEHHMSPDDVVAELRGEVLQKAKITVSAGIAPNTKIAKIASNKNKPNGQFRIVNERTVVMAFMRELPVRKVNGIGRVFDRELEAIGIKTCGDIYHQRGYLAKLFGQKAFQFLMHCYLGLGRTTVRPAEEYERKSIGTESTFRDLSGKAELRGKLRGAAEELERDLSRAQFKGRTLCLKVKLHTYEVLTRQTTPPKAVQLTEDLYQYALPMLSKLEQDIPGIKLRLMGLRVTHLVSTKKNGMDFFGAHGPVPIDYQNQGTKRKAAVLEEDGAEWEVWPEEEFEEVARQERQAETEELKALSQEQELKEINRRKGIENEANLSSMECGTGDKEQFWNCPVCFRPQLANDREFNGHVDFCLSRQTIREALKDSASGRARSSLNPKGSGLKGFSQLGNVNKNERP
ncbi:hypothetical protein FGG08_006210 [Glutinoglossum americanum]|uniref:DNA polymerase kappa n=1 Tax=Glutinoglossum americanum TaxID=1670608 RepID=A0A9P8KV68_9PEZI|nr:hypothetical protein FGG08_006210 [Glutinoglossum americanum]